MEKPKLITKKDAANALSVSTKTIDRLIKSQKIKAIRFNQRVTRINSAELGKYLNSTSNAAA